MSFYLSLSPTFCPLFSCPVKWKHKKAPKISLKSQPEEGPTAITWTGHITTYCSRVRHAFGPLINSPSALVYWDMDSSPTKGPNRALTVHVMYWVNMETVMVHWGADGSVLEFITLHQFWQSVEILDGKLHMSDINVRSFNFGTNLWMYRNSSLPQRLTQSSAQRKLFLMSKHRRSVDVGCKPKWRAYCLMMKKYSEESYAEQNSYYSKFNLCAETRQAKNKKLFWFCWDRRWSPCHV